MSQGKALSRRDFLRGCAGAAGLALVAGCTAPVQAPATDTTAADGAPAQSAVELLYWSAVHQEWAEAKIEEYQAENPNVNIELVTFGSTLDMNPKMITASAGGTAPNLVFQDRFLVAGWAGRGGATPITDLLPAYDINADDFLEATWNECVWLDQIYGVPFDTDVRAVFWNPELFAEAGLDPDTPPPTHDWEAMVELAGKLTKSASDGSIEIMGFIPTQVLSNAYGNGGDYIYVWANDGDFLKDERTAWMDNPKIVETLQWEYDITNAVGGIDKAAEFSSGWPSMAGFNPFGSGYLAMMVNGGWNLADFAEYYPDLEFNVGIWRKRGQEDDYVNFSGGFCLSLPAGAQHVDETFALVSFLSSYEAQLDAAIRYQRIPALKAAVADKALLDSSPYPEKQKIINESAAYGRFRPVSPVAGQIHSYWVRPGTGRDWVMYGEKSAEQACADMNVAIQEELDAFWSSVEG